MDDIVTTILITEQIITAPIVLEVITIVAPIQFGIVGPQGEQGIPGSEVASIDCGTFN